MKFHKKFHVVALLAAILALNAQAAEVSSVQVRRAVSAWAAANGSAFANPGSVVDATPVKDSDGTVLYWIVTMSNGGAVIASPDTDLDLVIAVLEKSDGTFPAGHPLPSILKKDMKNRLSIIRSGSASSSSSGNSGVLMASMLNATTQSTAAELPEDVKASVEKANAQWAKYGNRNAGVNLLGASLEGGDASPYVRRIVDGFETGGRFTHWNQSNRDGKPLYNLYTPYNEVCGCVATAGAAIMQFFGENSLSKKHDIGEVASTLSTGCTLYGQKYDCKTIPGEIDWAASQLPNYSASGTFATELTEEQRQLIGQITYNMGVLVGMSWASDGPGGESGAYLTQLDDALKAYGFKSARYVSFAKGDTDTAQFRKTVFAQNWAGAPVALGISSDEGGHAVIACGYAKDGDNDEFCRVFMGWGGNGDSWYNFPEIRSYDVINEAVTMIGFETDQVVPVCGKANVANITLTIPNGTYVVNMPEEEGGDPTVEPGPLSVPVDEKGYFAARIPISMKNPVIEYTNPETSGVTSMAITPFDSKVLGKEEDRAKLEAATPAEMMFLVLNMTVKSTVASARAVALRDNKALLMVSGAGSAREEALIDYITYLDSTEDLANKFVFVRVNSSDASSIDGDGDPSIGVFNPEDGSAELRWWEENGRLEYENFIDCDATASTNVVVYTFEATNTVNMTNSVMRVMSEGYDKFLRATSGISVTVEAVDALTGTEIPLEGVSPECGEFNNVWTNGEVAVFSAASGVYTNFNDGVVYSCVGWEMYGADGIITNGLGTHVEIVLEKDTEATFVWCCEPSHYRVQASFIGLPASGVEKGRVVVTPENAWVEADARVTLKAEQELGDYRLKEWNLSRASGADYAAYYNGSKSYDAYVIQNGGTISFFVYEPVSVVAGYSDSSVGSITGEPEVYTFEILSSQEDSKDLVSLKYGCVWGTNTTIDPVIHLEPAVLSYKDSTNVEWVCTGWEINGTQYDGADAAFMLYNSDIVYSVKCLWSVKPDTIPDAGGDDGEDEPSDPVEPGQDPVLVPIAFSSVAQDASGVWTLTLTNAVKDCWYHLEYTDSLSPVNWLPVVSIQATEDGPITFKAVGNATGGGRFWRARATVKETDN